MTGTTLSRVARLVFDPHVVKTVVEPTIADLQREVASAATRAERVRARWRGYTAFWSLILLAPVSFWWSPAQERGSIAFPDVMARVSVSAILVVLGAIVGPVLFGWLALAVAAGAALAFVIHAWYNRHPSFIPDPKEAPVSSAPQINFSSTGVAGNVGGLIFAIGTVIIVTLAVPGLLWFLCAALLTGALCGWALLRWHRRHPKSGLPENLIELR
jgi:hypothetical protein